MANHLPAAAAIQTLNSDAPGADALQSMLVTLAEIKFDEFTRGGADSDKARQEELDRQAREQQVAQDKKKEDKKEEEARNEQVTHAKQASERAAELAQQFERAQALSSSSVSSTVFAGIDPHDLRADLVEQISASEIFGSNIFTDDAFGNASSISPEAIIQRLDADIARVETEAAQARLQPTVIVAPVFGTQGVFSPAPGFVREDIAVIAIDDKDNRFTIDAAFLQIDEASGIATVTEDILTEIPHAELRIPVYAENGEITDFDLVPFNRAPAVLLAGTELQIAGARSSSPSDSYASAA